MAKIFPHIPAFPRYTSIGCYPILYVVNNDENPGEAVLCADCATEELRTAHENGTHRAFKLAQDANWEDPDLYCEGCNERIESAYAEPEICHETGYTGCACRDCFEIAIGTKGEPKPMCHECETAGCELNSECSREPDPEESDESEATES